jgi:general secretion pathway protein M
MKAALAPARLWWQQRSLRERVLVALAAAALAAYAATVTAVRPALEAREEALAAIARFEAMQARLAASGSGPVTEPPPSDQPVAAVVTDSAPAYGLAIRRIETDQAGTRVELDDAGFAEIVLWIEELERQHGLRVVTVEMDRGPEPGVVAARLAVRR